LGQLVFGGISGRGHHNVGRLTSLITNPRSAVLATHSIVDILRAYADSALRTPGRAQNLRADRPLITDVSLPGGMNGRPVARCRARDREI
jgi:hypothetical protein